MQETHFTFASDCRVLEDDYVVLSVCGRRSSVGVSLLIGRSFNANVNIVLADDRGSHFDGSVIKTLGYFEDSLELEDKVEEIPLIVTTCKKNHRLSGNYVLNINSSKLINAIKMEKNGKLKKNYEASLKLKENITPSYYEARKLPVHFLPLIAAKLRKLIEQGLLEHVPPGHHPL